MRKSERAQATIIGSHRIEIRGGTLTHPDSGRSLDVGTTPRIIGRSDCDFRVDDPTVSAAHCELVATEGGARLRDLTSGNGTFIAGVRVIEVLLTKPTQIRVGKTVFDFVPAEAESHLLPSTFGGLESHSPSMQAVFERLKEVARTPINVHLTGETGTGKGYIARRIHEESRRKNKPFVTINFGQIAPTLIESALFGHVKGAFTGAEHKISPLVEADGGTVFADEIGDLPLPLQSKLLRVFDEKVFQPVGSTRDQRVDVRFISATLHNLQEKVNQKEFRGDLLHRLGPSIELPPLRDRREDIGLLTKQILVDKRLGELFDEISPATLDWMMSRSWDGNLRGLHNVIEVAIAFKEEDGRALDIERAIRAYQGAERPSSASRPAALTATDSLVHAAISRADASSADVERAAREMFLRKLNVECDGVVAEIARRSKLSRKFVRSELASMGIRPRAKAWGKR